MAQFYADKYDQAAAQEAGLAGLTTATPTATTTVKARRYQSDTQISICFA